MNQTFEFSLARLGILAFTIPAALIILFSREWFLRSVEEKFGFVPDRENKLKSKNPLLTFDIWAFVLIVFRSLSWGGMNTRGRRDTLIGFISAQFWFLILIIVSVIFLHTRNLDHTGYFYLLLVEIIRKSWSLHLINYIPIPPFDASYFYAQTSKWRNMTLYSKIIATILIVLFPIHNDFITGDILIKWIGL